MTLVDAFFPSADAPGRILVADDEPDNREILLMQLAGHPFHVTVAATGVEALALAEGQPFEGILMDVHLPDLSGIEVCRRLRQLQHHRQTPLIFISSVRMKEEDLVEGLAAGGLDYLTWPYSTAELLAKLRIIIGLSRQQEALLASERNRTLTEVVYGASQELSQPITSAQLLLDLWKTRGGIPTPLEVDLLQDLLSRLSAVLNQLRELKVFIPKPYGSRAMILDVEASHRASREADAPGERPDS